MESLALNLPKLRPLQIVSLVAAGQSVAAAARTAGVTPSAATQAIGTLEAALDLRLFTRGRHGLVANDYALIVRNRYDAANGHLRRGLAQFYPGRTPEARNQVLRRLSARLIETFLAVRNPGSTATLLSAWLRTSRSAVYRSLAELEEVLGVRVVERRQNGLNLTEAGADLVGFFLLAAQDLVAIRRDIAALNGQAIGEIRLGSIVTGHARIIPQAIAGALQAMPQVTYAVTTADSARLLDLLRQGEVDFALVSTRDTGQPGLRFLEMGVRPFYVTCRRDHPLLRLPPPAAADLSAYPWVRPTVGSHARRCFELIFAGAGLPPPPVITELDTSEILRGLLAQSDCLALMSADRIASEGAFSPVAALDFAVPGSAPQLQLVTRLDWTPYRAQQIFLDVIRTLRDRG